MIRKMSQTGVGITCIQHKYVDITAIMTTIEISTRLMTLPRLLLLGKQQYLCDETDRPGEGKHIL